MNHSNKPDNVSTSVVSDVMSTSLVTMSSKSSMYDVAKKMSECRVSSIFLTIDGKATISDSNSWSESKIVGLVTQTDLVEKVCAKDKLASGITVETVMSPVIAISEDAKVEEATQMMNEKRIRHFAVDAVGQGLDVPLRHRLGACIQLSDGLRDLGDDVAGEHLNHTGAPET